MRTVLVTGCAGFIGSQVAEACLSLGDRVIGVDSLTDYYDVGLKLANVRGLRRFDRFEFVGEDIERVASDVVAGVDVVFHEAGQPGVRSSWHGAIPLYLSRNVAATDRLLAAAVEARVQRFVFASSSSVYGDAAVAQVDERQLPRPLSPYGVTKLAAEHLCTAYAADTGLSVVSLRYFSVYGPRQRPDMAIHRLVESALAGSPFPMYGDGSQVRDHTFVGDVVRANLAAAEADAPAGLVVNVAGGSLCSLTELVSDVQDLVGTPLVVERRPHSAGDARRTSGSIELAAHVLGWQPQVGMREGLSHQIAWHRDARATSSTAER